jgi:excisionase family DNA binding protein
MPVAERAYMTVSEVAAELRLSRRTIYRAIARHELVALRFTPRGTLRIPSEQLVRLAYLPKEQT